MIRLRWTPFLLALALARPSSAASQQAGPEPTPPGARAVGSLRGELFDSLLGGRLEGAQVRVLGTRLLATTDQRGRFRFDSVPAGSRVLVVDHPALDSAGLSDLPRRVDVVAGRTTQVRLAVPSLRTLAFSVCDGDAAALGRDSGIVFGAVRDAESGLRLVGARVALWWIAIERPEGQLEVNRRVRDVRTDSVGNYYVCSVAKRTEFRLQASAGGFASGALVMEVGDRRVLRHDLSVSREVLEEPLDSVSGLSRGLATLVGSVRSEAGVPLGMVQASVPGASSDAVTDAAGRFVLRSLPSGSQMLTLRRIGYRVSWTSVDLRNRDTTRVSLELSTVTVLDTLRVTASRWVRSELDELESRLHGLSTGYALTQEDLRPLYDLRTAFYNLPSLRVEPARGGYNLLSQRGPRMCSVDIWIDGVRQDVEVLQTYQPADVIAIEYFPRGGNAPFRYQPSSFSTCGAALPGVVLVWTRFLR